MVSQIQIHPNLFSIASPYRGILLDAYGVFWGGQEVGLLPGAKKAMETLVTQGKIVGILSNTTQLSTTEIKKLEKSGLIQGTHFHFLVTAGSATRDLALKQEIPFETHSKKFLLFTDEHPKFPFSGIFTDSAYSKTDNPQEADFIFLNVPHINGNDETDPNLFKDHVLKAFKTGLPMLCANPDRFAHEGNPPKAVVRQGSIAALYESLGGKVFYVGKPGTYVYKIAFEEFKKFSVDEAQHILMVGDTPETDIRGARAFGIASSLLTNTGMLAERAKTEDLKTLLVNLPTEEYPTFFVERLGSPDFELHPNLAKKTFVIDLPLCRVLMENDSHYPWIFLVPRKNGVSRLMDLSSEDQIQLMKELDVAQKILWEEFQPKQLNVAAIGNKTPQLHVHVIARNEDDPAWPNTVWDHPLRTPLTPEELTKRLETLKSRFQKEPFN